jgi:hypothetical protein
MRQVLAALRDFDPADVRFESKADNRPHVEKSGMSALPPKADIDRRGGECPLCAKRGHSHCSKIFLFDHLVGE